MGKNLSKANQQNTSTAKSPTATQSAQKPSEPVMTKNPAASPTPPNTANVISDGSGDGSGNFIDTCIKFK